MTYLSDILNSKDLFDACLIAGFVSERAHPLYPELRILNYTPKAQFENEWNDVTTASRGLIYNADTHLVLARPFKKFFNYGQGEAEFDLNARVYHVADKLDGSLGIGYRLPTGEWAIATRGSFDSEQARHATAWLAQHPDVTAWMDWEEEWGCTPLFEIIYPENRIVVDYGDRDALIALGSVEIQDGHYHSTPAAPERAAAFADLSTLREALAAPVRPNSEGMVVWTDPWTAVKIKQADYVELHRIVTGLNRKAIWREVQLGPESFKAFLAQLPDELYAWAIGVAQELNEQFGARMWEIDQNYLDLQDRIDVMRECALEYEPTRAWIAGYIKSSFAPQFHGYMFSLLDGRDISEKIWRELEPKGGER